MSSRRVFETSIKNVDTGDVLTFRSINAAATHMNADRASVKKAYARGAVIRARDGSVWTIEHIAE